MSEQNPDVDQFVTKLREFLTTDYFSSGLETRPGYEVNVAQAILLVGNRLEERLKNIEELLKQAV